MENQIIISNNIWCVVNVLKLVDIVLTITFFRNELFDGLVSLSLIGTYSTDSVKHFYGHRLLHYSVVKSY